MTRINSKVDSTAFTMQWLARGISTLFIAFLLIMAVGSALAPPEVKSQTRTHEGWVIGAFILITFVGVIIAWWREGIGGLILTIAGLAMMVYLMWTLPPGDYWVILIFCIPFLLSSILFLICWRRIGKLDILPSSAE